MTQEQTKFSTKVGLPELAKQLGNPSSSSAMSSVRCR